MKISIKNLSNKKRSKKSMNELKDFAGSMADNLNISHKIKEIRLVYKKRLVGYYGKGKPFKGFKKLYNNGIVRIDLAQKWDYSKLANKVTVLHELTHVKQMVEKRMKINKSMTILKWNNKVNESWKGFTFKKMHECVKISGEATQKYIVKHFPWEGEVTTNLKKYLINKYLK